jgi:ABC-type uncharacterized transport system ATPase subunit
VLGLADPIGVLSDGRLVMVTPRAECRVEDLGLAMAGAA